MPFALTGPGIARQGNPIIGGGVVTCGTLCPCLNVGIGMAYVPHDKAEPGTAFEIDVRGKARTAEVARSPSTARRPDHGRGQLPDRPAVPRRARLGSHRRRHRHVRASPGTRRSSSARSCSSTRPRSAATVTKDQPYAEVESVKAVSTWSRRCRGEIVEVNEALSDTPEQINEDPYGEGWMVKVRLSEPSRGGRPDGRRPPTRAPST